MSERVERVQGLRSSGAAGPHGHRPPRAEWRAEFWRAEFGEEAAEAIEAVVAEYADAKEA